MKVSGSKGKTPDEQPDEQGNLQENGFERLPEWKDAVARYLKEITW